MAVCYTPCAAFTAARQTRGMDVVAYSMITLSFQVLLLLCRKLFLFVNLALLLNDPCVAYHFVSRNVVQYTESSPQTL